MTISTVAACATPWEWQLIARSLQPYPLSLTHATDSTKLKATHHQPKWLRSGNLFSGPRSLNRVSWLVYLHVLQCNPKLPEASNLHVMHVVYHAFAICFVCQLWVLFLWIHVWFVVLFVHADMPMSVGLVWRGLWPNVFYIACRLSRHVKSDCRRAA